ncbi:MAG: hypothetical protein H0T46_02800 [Deltaproteobacteria bacterium]|nr:hypothetical protein [Deltaproteobacteria bacterium]
MIDTSSTTTETWARRVEAWRASGKRAEDFSRHEGYAASTLRWWSSKLKHEMPRAPEVRLARVVRTVTAAPAPGPALASPFAAIVIDVTPTSVRVAVAPGADRETLAMVLDVVRAGAAR